MIDVLLRRHADETVLNNEGEAAVDVVDTLGEGARLAEDVEQMRKLLVNAPADRHGVAGGTW